MLKMEKRCIRNRTINEGHFYKQDQISREVQSRNVQHNEEESRGIEILLQESSESRLKIKNIYIFIHR